MILAVPRNVPRKMDQAYMRKLQKMVKNRAPVLMIRTAAHQECVFPQRF